MEINKNPDNLVASANKISKLPTALDPTKRPLLPKPAPRRPPCPSKKPPVPQQRPSKLVQQPSESHDTPIVHHQLHIPPAFQEKSPLVLHDKPPAHHKKQPVLKEKPSVALQEKRSPFEERKFHNKPPALHKRPDILHKKPLEVPHDKQQITNNDQYKEDKTTLLQNGHDVLPQKLSPVKVRKFNGVTNLNKLKSISAPDLCADVKHRPVSSVFYDKEIIWEEEDTIDGKNDKARKISDLAGKAITNLKTNKLKNVAKKGVRKWQSFMDHKSAIHTSTIKNAEESTVANDSSTDRFSELHLDIDSQLFDYLVVVSLKSEAVGKFTPFITFQFPPKLDKQIHLLESIPQFCFPGDSSCLGYNHGETFSFVLTNDTGARSYGFCRMIQTATMKQPEVYCIVSQYGLFTLYTQILEEVQFQRQFSSTAVFSFLKAILSKPLPQPTESLDVRFFSSGSKEGIRNITLTRPGDSAIHEHVQLSLLFERLPPETVLQLLGYLLIESKVVLCSKSLSLLSSSCHALISLMYPFDWEHTFIPVLPVKLVDVLCLPTPYLLGIMPAVLPELEDLPIEDASILDLDTKQWVVKSNVKSTLPKNLCDQVISSLKDAMDVSSSSESGKEKDQNEIVSEIFVQMYLQLMGHFENHYTEIDGVPTINYRPFYKASHTKEQKAFLKVFAPTQAFQKFTMSRKIDGPSHGLFESRYSTYRNSKSMDRTGHFKKSIEGLLNAFKKK